MAARYGTATMATEHAYPIPIGMTADEALLEDIRMLIMGGILVAAPFDRDDIPLADRIAAANDLARQEGGE